MEKNFQQEILRRLDTLIKLQTLSSMKDDTQLRKIDLLNNAGFGPKEIADIIGTTNNTVSVALHKLKKKDTKKKEAKSDKPESTKSLGSATESIRKDAEIPSTEEEKRP